MEKFYSVGQFAEMIGKSVQTMQRWDREGTMTAYRSPSGRRYYTHTQYLEYIGQPIIEDKKTVIYTRVSSNGQKHDLERQTEFLINYCHTNGIEISDIYSDIGSGLNYNRKKWNKLIKECFEGKIKTIYIAYQDRFVRFGYNWIVQLLHDLTGVNIISINDVVLSPEEEVVQDLITIIHVFSSRVYGLRKYKKKLEKDESVNHA